LNVILSRACLASRSRDANRCSIGSTPSANSW
jgi:hypothetical protein